MTYECVEDWPEFGPEPTTPRLTYAARFKPWRQRKLYVFSSPVSSPISLPLEALHTALTAMTVRSASIVVQIVSAEKPVFTAPTITNVAQAKCAVMAAIVCHIALSGPEELLPAL